MVEAVEVGLGGERGLRLDPGPVHRQPDALHPAALHQLVVALPVGPLRRHPGERGGRRAAGAGAASRSRAKIAPRMASFRCHRVVGPGLVSEIIVAAFGAWRSLVARTVRVGEVPGSNPGAPISYPCQVNSRCGRDPRPHLGFRIPDRGDRAFDLPQGGPVLQGAGPSGR